MVIPTNAPCATVLIGQTHDRKPHAKKSMQAGRPSTHDPLPKKGWRKPSHIRIVRAAAALWGHPIDVLRRVLDVARLAVDAVLRIDHKTRIALFRLVAIDHFVDGGGAVEPRRLAIFRQVSLNRNRRILEEQMTGLVFLMIGV